MLNSLANGKIQGLFKAFECFQGKVDFQGLFKTVLYIQVLFKPVQTLSPFEKNQNIHDPNTRHKIPAKSDKWFRRKKRMSIFK